MNTTIKYIAAAMLLIITVTAHAQQPVKRTPEERAKREAQGLKNQFSLTDAQTAQCEQIIKKYAGKLAETRQAAKADSTKNKNAKQQLLKLRDDEIKAVLTTDQKSKFDNWKQEKQRHNGKAMRAPGDSTSRK